MDAHTRNKYVYSLILKVWVTVMVTKQPFYIGSITHDNVETVSGSAYGALSMFIFTFGTSVFGIFFHNRNMAMKQDMLMSDADLRPLFPPGMSDYQVNSMTPMQID